jgi:glycosyltransferase involved in cell wall biosynthesis
LLAKDESFVRRCWRSGKHDNGFDELSAAVRELALDVLVIQFNYAFFEFEPLSNFLQLQADEGRVVIVTVHATADPPAPASNDTNWSLRSTLPGLARCDRVLAHCLADLNRLRLLGLTDNVTLFPHPLLSLPVDGEPTAMRAGGDFLIATFGFCLPHKGLVEVVNAVAQLRRQGLGVRLLMLNAEFSSESSRHLAEQLRGEIARLGLEGEVDLRTEFLSDHEIAKLLHQADLIVYAYQNTQESASGAVRQGMAAGRPLLVTPHPIFDELGSSVFRAAGSTSAALATAIRSALAEIADSTPEAASVAEHASRWRAGHDLDRSARRLMGMARGLLRLRQQDSTAEGFFFDGSSRQLRGEVALSDHRSRAGNGKAGTFCAGPLAALAGGTHEAILQWSGPLEGRFRCEVLHHGGQRSVADLWLSPGGLDAVCRVPFTLSRPAGDVEIRLTVADGFLGKLESLTLRPALHHGTG